MIEWIRNTEYNANELDEFVEEQRKLNNIVKLFLDLYDTSKKNTFTEENKIDEYINFFLIVLKKYRFSFDMKNLEFFLRFMDLKLFLRFESIILIPFNNYINDSDEKVSVANIRDKFIKNLPNDDIDELLEKLQQRISSFFEIAIDTLIIEYNIYIERKSIDFKNQTWVNIVALSHHTFKQRCAGASHF